jgi:hypothetical protein
VVEWDVKVISRSFYGPKWGVSTSEPDEIATEWKVFFRSAVNLTMPRRQMMTPPSGMWNFLVFLHHMRTIGCAMRFVPDTRGDDAHGIVKVTGE